MSRLRRFASDLNPTIRGFLIIGLIAAVVVVFQLQQTLAVAGILLRVAFFLAIAFFLFLLWRERLRHDIETWSRRAQTTFYAAAALIVVALGAAFATGFSLSGPSAAALVGTIVLAGFAMWRVWRDEHSYG